jgi:HEXXH motif-containing protein
MTAVADHAGSAELGHQLPPDLAGRGRQYRQDKIRRLDGLVDMADPAGGGWSPRLAGDMPMRYALAHHILEATERAAEQRDQGGVREALSLRADITPLRPVQADIGEVIVARPAESALAVDIKRSNMPVALLDAEICRSVTARQRDLVRAALATGAQAGFSDLLSRNCRVIVLLHRRALGDDVSSWTTSRLPGTVHLDFYDVHHFVARDLIHEAAHTEFNDLIRALDLAFPDDMSFYAPWRAKHRPFTAFLHGVWAFSHVVLYCRWLADARPEPRITALAEAMHAHHAAELAEVRDDSQRCVELMTEPALASLVAARRDEALATLAPGQRAGR